MTAEARGSLAASFSSLLPATYAPNGWDDVRPIYISARDITPLNATTLVLRVPPMPAYDITRAEPVLLTVPQTPGLKLRALQKLLKVAAGSGLQAGW